MRFDLQVTNALNDKTCRKFRCIWGVAYFNSLPIHHLDSCKFEALQGKREHRQQNLQQIIYELQQIMKERQKRGMSNEQQNLFQKWLWNGPCPWKSLVTQQMHQSSQSQPDSDKNTLKFHHQIANSIPTESLHKTLLIQFHSWR